MRYASFLGGLAFMCVLLDGCASTSKTQPTPPAPTPPAPITVSVGPTAANVSVGKTQQFTATTSGTTNTAVTWSVVRAASNGTISTGGLSTAPAPGPKPPT